MSRTFGSAPASTGGAIIAVLPRSATENSGVWLKRPRAFGSAPACSNAAISLGLFARAAACNAVYPNLSRAFGSTTLRPACASSNAVINSELPAGAN